MPRASHGATVTIRHAVDLSPDGKATVVIQNEAILHLRDTTDKPTDMYLGRASFATSTTLEKLSVSFGKGVRVTGGTRTAAAPLSYLADDRFAPSDREFRCLPNGRVGLYV